MNNNQYLKCTNNCNAGAHNELDVYCWRCGATLEKWIKECPKCKLTKGQSDRFCTKCGGGLVERKMPWEQNK